MDEVGWDALKKEEESYQEPFEQNADGSYRPRVVAAPMNDGLEGYSQNAGSPPAISPPAPRWGPPSVPPPGFPPPSAPPTSPQASRSPNAPPPYSVPQYHPSPWMPDGRPTVSGPGPAERSPISASLNKMEPHLQFLCGPLLRYDCVVNQVWYGAVLIVTADSGSIYTPNPSIYLEWGPIRPAAARSMSQSSGASYTGAVQGAQPFSQHPTDLYGGAAYGPVLSPVKTQANYDFSVRTGSATFPSRNIWVYNGPYGSCTFWRMMIQIPLMQNEMEVSYRINGGHPLNFYVPAIGQELRWATYSCGGFSQGINADDFKGPGHASGFDPVWNDLLEKHNQKPFHALVGGGDQLYCDALMREPELQEYIKLKSGEERIAYQLPESVKVAMDRFYFSHYCLMFRNGKFAVANSTIPMVNMLDDHDMIDGFGSYPDKLQLSPMFKQIGDRAYHFFLLFQCFVVDGVDGVDPHPGRHTTHSMIIGGPGAWIPYPSHSILTYMGPSTWMLMLDCRAERTLQTVCSEESYRRVFDRLWNLPAGVEHLVIQLGIPIAYPRMNFLETALESSFNPFVALGKKNKLGLGGMLNKFNNDAELLDDLMDHWTAKTHKKERNWFVEQLQNFSKTRGIRITFLSGDVHCAAVGVFKTLAPPGSQPVDPVVDHRYMLNVVTSAIVNTPPPVTVLTMVSQLSDNVHRTMHYAQTDETMIPLFQNDTDGKPRKFKNIMDRRNYTIVEFDSQKHELHFEIRVEKEKGVGNTVGYWIRAPRPGWQKS